MSTVALAQQPRIDTVTPAEGAIAGNTLVTLTGANLLGATVQLDGAPITPASQSANEIRMVMPKHDSGYVVLSARNASGTAYGEFLYVPPALDVLPPGFITTVAGIGTYVRDFGPAIGAVVGPSGLALAKNGVLYVGEPLFGKVDRVNTDGTLERVTHFGSAGLSSGDGGPAIDAVISFPISLAVDAAGNLYVPDHTYRIRRIDGATGIITTIAGDGIEGYSGDGGPAAAARIGLPSHCTISGDNFFFIDFDAMRVRRIDLKSGIISAYAGGGAGVAGDGGLALAAKFDVGDSDRGALAADSHGNLFLADSNNNRLRRIDAASGIITTFANANSIRALAVDGSDNVYYASGGHVVKLAPDGRVLDSWGGDQRFDHFPPDGASAHETFAGLIVGLAIEPNGNILFSDASVSRVRRINLATQKIETVAGIGPAIIGENGPAIASMISPTDLLMSDGSILFGDATLRIRRLDRNGNVSTVAGTGINGGLSYGAANRVTLAAVGVDADRLGNLDIADSSVVRRLRADGIVEPLIAHDPNCGYSGDGGPAVDATVCQPFETARDRNGNLFLADTNNNRIRRVDAQSGVITTIAGNGGRRNGFEGYGSGEDCGDGGPALDACINTPYGLALDAAGNLFIAGESRIRKVNILTGRIETFAANLHVTKLLFGFGGLLYGARFGGRLLRFDPSGASTEIAGSNPTADGIGDGLPASQALLRTAHQANGIAIDGEGNLFLADQGNGRIRAIRYGAVLAPPGATIQASSSGARITATVRDANGAPAPSVRIDYDVPASGASCRLANPFAITDASGTATVVCTPNCIAGTYSVTLRPVAGTSTTIPITNPPGPCRRHAL
jgi:sugar lactone lactonase YvrE